MKKIKKIMTSFLLSCMVVLLIGTPKISAESVKETGWIEVSVSVPENFDDQIYIQFQETNNIEDAFYGNTVQILPENGYVGRINLPVGDYEITMKTVYENPLIYNINLDAETELPISVTSSNTAALVKLNCEVRPIEELLELEGNIPEEILAAAQEISDKLAEEEQASQEPAEDSEVINEDVDVDIEADKGPFYRLAMGLLRTALFAGIIFGICYILYKFKSK